MLNFLCIIHQSNFYLRCTNIIRGTDNIAFQYPFDLYLRSLTKLIFIYLNNLCSIYKHVCLNYLHHFYVHVQYYIESSPNGCYLVNTNSLLVSTGRTLDFSFDVSSTPVIGERFLHPVSDEQNSQSSSKHSNSKQNGPTLSSPSVSSAGR